MVILKRYFVLVFLAGIFSQISCVDQNRSIVIDLKKSESPLSDAPLKEIVLDNVKIAKAENLKAFIQITAEWCTPCKKLRAVMNHKLMQSAFNGVFIIRIDADEWEKELPSIGIEVEAVPVFFEVGSNGKVTDYTINGGAWGEDIPENIAPPLAAYFHEALVRVE